MCILNIEEKESTKPGLARLKYSLRRQISQYIKAHLKANYNIQPSPFHCIVGGGLEDNATLKKTWPGDHLITVHVMGNSSIS